MRPSRRTSQIDGNPALAEHASTRLGAHGFRWTRGYPTTAVFMKRSACRRVEVNLNSMLSATPWTTPLTKSPLRSASPVVNVPKVS